MNGILVCSFCVTIYLFQQEKRPFMTAPILITGGAQRLGLAIAENLLSQHHSVIITYRSQKPSIDDLVKLGATAIHADFATNEGVVAFIQALQAQTSSLRGIIHNASDWESESAEATTAEHAQLFNKMMQVHANAPYLINLACEKMLLPGADIIHMTDYVQETGSKKHLAYAASKAALHNLTLSFANMLAPQVKVNSIAPSLLMFNDDDTEQYKQKALSKSLLEICPGAQEAVKAVNYILSSEYITGQTIHLNGGRHLK